MKIHQVVCVGAFLCAFTAFSVNAVPVKGQVTFSYKGGIFSSAPSDEDRAKAISQAKYAAIRSYVSQLSPIQQKVFSSIAAEAEANPDQYLKGSRIAAERINEDSKTLMVVVRADLDEGLLKSALHTDASATSGQNAGQGGVFASLFVARQVTESKVFDERHTSVSQEGESESVRASGMSESVTRTSVSARGGNTVRKASKNIHGELASTDFDAAFNDVMTTYGYEPADYVDVSNECKGPKIAAIKNAFMKTDELGDDLRKQAIRACRECGVRYFSLGTLNVSVPFKDSVSGLQRVTVSVNGMVWDLKNRLPRKVASVGPVQVNGLGSDDTTARREALKSAANKAAEVISTQLGSKNIR